MRQHINNNVPLADGISEYTAITQLTDHRGEPAHISNDGQAIGVLPIRRHDLNT